MNPVLLNLYEGLWAGLAGRAIQRFDAQSVHHRMIEALRLGDRFDAIPPAARWIQRHVLPDQPVDAGGVRLPHPLILAAGFVKGDGFADEDSALAAVDAGQDVLPGWRTMPALVGAVEFGSFTRHPRLGNPGTVMWRDDSTGSTQNRVGLRNPGARAAARFLAGQRAHLPPVWGINLAVSPGVSDPDQELAEIVEAAGFFVGSLGQPHPLAYEPITPGPLSHARGERMRGRRAKQVRARVARRGTRSICRAQTPTTTRAPTRPRPRRICCAAPWSRCCPPRCGSRSAPAWRRSSTRR
ncbi:MAG: hypothetical protein IPK19_01300 [Chloroflexi bacterium]|nr:hypothetical protein [Chloroflexota bacterium]